jgi:hypothetical protein
MTSKIMSFPSDDLNPKIKQVSGMQQDGAYS